MSRDRVLLLLLCGSMLVPSSSRAQTSEQLVPGYVLKRWTTAEGLPQDTISGIVQTRDGYLWIATPNAGFIRFDGVTFTTFNALNTPGLASDRGGLLLEDAEGTLWMASTSGLARYRDGVFTTERLGEDAMDNVVSDISTDREGRVWVVSYGNVFRRDGNHWTRIPSGHGTRHRAAASRDGTMWIATAEGLIEWRDAIVRTWTMRDGLPSDSVRAVREDSAGRLWVGTDRGLASLDRARGRMVLEPGRVGSAHIWEIFEDSRHVLWIGATGALFSRSPEGTVMESALVGGTGADTGRVTNVTEDSEGQIWFGVQVGRGGLHRLTPASVRTIGGADGFPCENVGAVTQAPDDTIWAAPFCEEGAGLVAIGARSATFHRGPAVVQALLADADATLWAGSMDGRLFRVHGGQFVEVPAPTNQMKDEIGILYRHADGSLWLGTNRGLVILRDGQWTRLRVSDGLPSDIVQAIASDGDAAVWIGTDAGISRFQDGKFTSYGTADGVPVGPVRALYLDTDGVLWIGTYGGGLARFKGGAITAYGDQGGLLDTSVHRIFEDEEGYLWLTGDRGIRRAPKRELNAIADGRGGSLDVIVYTTVDGMRSIECNGMGRPAGWRARDGAFYIPTQRDLVRIDPAIAARDTPPVLKPRIESTLVDGAPASSPSEVVATPGYRDVEIRYTAPALAKPELVQFRYRLEGYTTEWVDIGTRRVVSFVNLRPGRYRFLLSARHSSGEWSPPAVATLVLQPFFFQRISFQIGLGVLSLALAVIAGRQYVNSLRRRAAELEQAVAERTVDLSAAKHEVEQAHGQLLAVLDQLDIGVLVLGHSGLVRYASASAQRVLRKDEYALVGQSWSASLPLVQADLVKVKERVERRSAFRGRVPAQMVIDGTRYWLEIDVRDEPPPGDGRILYMYSVAEVSRTSDKSGTTGLLGLVGRSTPMHVVYKQIRDVARVDSTVLIQGETGVGKELVARAIHRESARADKPFVAVNAAGLSESLVASQLFGHRRGAFTGAEQDQVGVFEAANGGTVFLDEIGDMPPGVQVSLLRVLQEREITRLGESQPRRVDVRFLAATHRDLAREVEAGRFREDLLYRIRVATIVVPPLRNRLDDVPLLVDLFLNDAAGEAQRPVPVLTRDVIDALMRYEWPGNVRQLRAAIERSLVNTQEDIIRPEDLPPEIVGRAPVAAVNMASERDRIIEALRQAKGNRTEAARLLGISRTTLYRRLWEYGLDSPDK